MAAIEVLQTLEYRGSQLNATPVLEDFQDSPDDDEDTRSNHEYLNDQEEEYQARALLAKSKRFFKKGTQRFSSAKITDKTKCHKCGKKCHFTRDCWSKASVPSYQSPFQPKPLSSSQHKPELRPTKDFEAKYNKVKAKLALLSSSDSASKAGNIKNKGLITEAYEWDEEEVLSYDNEMVEVKVPMALAEENDAISKEGARNGEWVKISMRKGRSAAHKINCVAYLEIKCDGNLMFIEEIGSVAHNLLGISSSEPGVIKHVNTEILKENKNLRTELKELTTIDETWLNSSNKVNQCIGEQISSQKKRILGVDQLTVDPSNSVQKDLVFVKSSADETKVSIPSVKRPKLSEAEDVQSEAPTPLSPPKKLDGNEPISGRKTIKLIFRSKSTFKAETLKGVKINKPSSTPAKGNKSSLASKVNSAPAGKLKSMKIKDDPSLAIVIKELNDLK
ncbi:retrovirus-related pol polyprotein from transposon TNT 1-94 [Tanacetum coccineum]|uniref:Retrovirus-related pol polyprotein from transposon TNT 1-94 n=1 Tax=Tanacetum coccineum TaxID=301880 RepID=A0ABQ5IB45_9ASTR